MKEGELSYLPRILNHSYVTSPILKELAYLEIPSVIYVSEESIQLNIANFNKFVKTNFNKFGYRCISEGQFHLAKSLCADSHFIDNNRGHILTEDLRIFNKNKLMKRFTKGPKYREIMFVNFK